jgi:probable rRNA maturation factor
MMSAPQLCITARAARHLVPFLRRKLLEAMQLCGATPRHLSVALVGDRVMSRLHQRHLGIDGPTDVLAFPLEQRPHGRVVEGEIVICVGEARRQSRRHGTPLNHEVLLYAIHGLLHLRGMDDTTPAGFERMHRMEDALLTRLGIGPVFRPNGRRRPSPRRRPARLSSRCGVRP